MKIKKGDTVIVTTGADAGKKGAVLRVYPLQNKVIVEGVRVGGQVKRANIRGAKAQVIQIAKPIHASNVMVVDGKSGKKSRVGFSVISGKKVRIAKRSGQEIK